MREEMVYIKLSKDEDFKAELGGLAEKSRELKGKKSSTKKQKEAKDKGAK